MLTISRAPSPCRRLLVTALLPLCGALPAAGVAAAGEKAPGRVRLLKTPDGGIQPQAVLDARGVLHLLYYKGDPAAGDLYYVRRGPGQERFSAPLRVNSQPGSAIAVGSIRGGQLAVGKGGRVHVAWNGSGKARPQGPGRYNAPMLYSRQSDDGTAFEPQRNLMHESTALDGGGTVAADEAGNVHVAWHALPVKAEPGEGNRTVWLARSADEGKTFAPAAAVLPRPTGTCGCCGMRAFADRKGNVYVLYRAATEAVHRDMHLLVSQDRGKSFRDVLAHPWQTRTCPMSSEAFAEGARGVLAAWDTEGQVYYTRIDPAAGAAGRPVPAPGPGRGRKHPVLAAGGRGETLLAWAEGTGWERGGALAWQVFDADGRPTPERGRLEGAVPVWGLPAVVAGPDGTFLIFH
jgi:hypothetical protein